MEDPTFFQGNGTEFFPDGLKMVCGISAGIFSDTYSVAEPYDLQVRKFIPDYPDRQSVTKCSRLVRHGMPLD